MQLFRTFQQDRHSFEQARSAHASVDTATREFLHRVTPNAPKDGERWCRRIWDCLQMFEPKDPDSEDIRDSILITAGIKTKVLLSLHEIVITFAYCHFLKLIKDVEDFEEQSFRGICEKVWKYLHDRRRAVNDIEEGFGCDQSEAWLTYRKIRNLPQSTMLEQKIRQIANLAGRMFDVYDYHTKRTPSDDPQEVEGSTQGGQVERLLPSQQALLVTPETADVTAMKLVKNQAHQFDMKGERSTRRGPLVLCGDSSGSMHDYGNIGRNTWCKAVLVSLTRLAWAEGRDVVFIDFSSSTIVQRMKRNDPKALFEMSRVFQSGGTSIGTALNRAVGEAVRLEKATRSGADIVLVTDGEDHDLGPIDRAIKQMQVKGIDLYTVSIGVDTHQSSPIRAKAKHYVHAQDKVLAQQDGALIAAQLKQAALDDKSLN